MVIVRNAPFNMNVDQKKILLYDAIMPGMERVFTHCWISQIRKDFENVYKKPQISIKKVKNLNFNMEANKNCLHT